LHCDHLGKWDGHGACIVHSQRMKPSERHIGLLIYSRSQIFVMFNALPLFIKKDSATIPSELIASSENSTFEQLWKFLSTALKILQELKSSVIYVMYLELIYQQ